MSMVINTNIAAIRTNNVYSKNNEYMNEALTKVATGQKVNSSKDNASTYAITEKMRDRIRANDQANQNVQNDQALLKTAQGGIGNTIDILKTLKERAVNAANDSNINTDRGAIQTEINQLLAQIEENAQKVKFNGRILLNGSAGNDSTKASPDAAQVTAGDSTTEISSTAISLTGNTIISNDSVLALINATEASPTNNASTTLSSVSSTSGNVTTSLVGSSSGAALSDGTITYNDGNSAGSTAGWYLTSPSSGTLDVYVKTVTTTGGSNFGGGITTGAATTGQTGLNFYVGGESGFNMSFDLDDMTLEGLKLSDSSGDSLIDVTDSTKAQSSIKVIDDALEYALKAQTKTGAMEARLGYTSDNLVTMNENLEAASSTMRDADMAKEMTNYMKYSVLAQASQYMLAQAGQNAFSVLNLLQA